MVVVYQDVAAPEEIEIINERGPKPTPYTVCYGCGGSVQNDAYEVDKEMVCETWHEECFEAEQDDGSHEPQEDEEEYSIAYVEDGNY